MPIDITILPDSVSRITSRLSEVGPFSMARFDVFIGDTKQFDEALQEGWEFRITGFLFNPIGVEKSYGTEAIGYVKVPTTYARGGYSPLGIIQATNPMLRSLKEALLENDEIRKQIGFWSGPQSMTINEWCKHEFGWSPYE